MVHIAKEFGSMKHNKMHAAEAWNEIQRMRIHDSPSCEFTDFKIEMLGTIFCTTNIIYS